MSYEQTYEVSDSETDSDKSPLATGALSDTQLPT